MVEGHGSYVLGCEPEREYKFNTKKRSRKHLRTDIRRREEKAEREKEEEERRAREAAEADNDEDDCDEEGEEEEEEEELIVEYLVYICECCNKR